jgi:hypothetical protein
MKDKVVGGWEVTLRGLSLKQEGGGEGNTYQVDYHYNMGEYQYYILFHCSL